MTVPSTPPNPIYERLTRGSRQQTRRQETGVRDVAAAAGVLTGLFVLIFALVGASPLAVLLFNAVGLLVLSVLARSLVAAATLTVHYAPAQDHTLLRLTNLTSRSIAEAYIEGVQAHLGLIRTIARGYLSGFAGGWGILAVLFVCFSSIAASPYVSPDGIVVLAFSILVMAALPFHVAILSRSMVVIGVWLGLRWPSHAPGMASTVVGLLVMGVLVSTGLALSGWTLGVACASILFLLSPLVTKTAEDFALEDIVRFVNGRVGI
jgi:hypothetical protein